MYVKFISILVKNLSFSLLPVYLPPWFTCTEPCTITWFYWGRNNFSVKEQFREKLNTSCGLNSSEQHWFRLRRWETCIGFASTATRYKRMWFANSISETSQTLYSMFPVSHSSINFIVTDLYSLKLHMVFTVCQIDIITEETIISHFLHN